MILPEIVELVAMRGAAKGLNLRAHRPALAHLYGSHHSAQRGRGLEFEEVRPYAAGDDIRSIDWRVTARRGQPHTKLFREERERPVWLVLDLHAGLFFGSRRQLKSALMLRAAALLGWVAVLGGDRLGAVITDDRNHADMPLILPPRTREAGILPILDALVASQPKTPASPKNTGLQRALTTLLPVLQPGSLVMILSDFSELDAASEVALTAISAHSDCRLIWLTDPLEQSGLPQGRYHVGLPDRLWWLDGAKSQRQWSQVWHERRQRLSDLSQRLNIPLTKLSTVDDVATTLPSLLREPTWAA